MGIARRAERRRARVRHRAWESAAAPLSLPPHGFVFPFILVAGHVAALIADRCVMDENGFAGPRRGLVLVGYFTRDADSSDNDVTPGENSVKGSVDR